MRMIKAEHVARMLGRLDADASIADIHKASALLSSGERERASNRADFLREMIADLEDLARYDVTDTAPEPVPYTKASAGR